MRSSDCVAVHQPNKMENWAKRRLVTAESDELDGALHETYGVPRKNIKNVKAQYQALTMLMKNEADATVSDCHVLKYYVNGSLNTTPFELKELAVEEGDTSYDLVIGLRKDHKELVQKINQGIENLKQNGELAKIIAKWTGKKDAPNPKAQAASLSAAHLK